MPDFALDVQSLRVVLFDVVGTLLFADPPVVDVYADIGRRCGSDASRLEIAAAFRVALGEQDALDRRVYALRTDEARERDRWLAVVAAALGEAADSQAALALLWEHFAQPTSWRLATDAAELFDEVERRGLAWGLASNFDGRLHSICHGLPPLAHCRHRFVSSEIGWRKPSPNFFRVIEQRPELSAEGLVAGGGRSNERLSRRAIGRLAS